VSKRSFLDEIEALAHEVPGLWREILIAAKEAKRRREEIIFWYNEFENEVKEVLEYTRRIEQRQIEVGEKFISKKPVVLCCRDSEEEEYLWMGLFRGRVAHFFEVQRQGVKAIERLKRKIEEMSKNE